MASVMSGWPAGPAAQLDMSYALTVVSRSGAWYVVDISAAAILRGRHDPAPQAARSHQAMRYPHSPE